MLRECSFPTMCHMSGVMCHVSRVMCHIFFGGGGGGQSGGASRWKVCYQRGLPCLVFYKPAAKFNYLKSYLSLNCKFHKNYFIFYFFVYTLRIFFTYFMLDISSTLGEVGVWVWV